MDERIARRATVHDVAREAGVSLATVDRVLNGRPGVRPVTAEKVADAIRSLDFRRDLSASLLARARDLRVAFLIPDGRNEFMVNLESAIARFTRPAKTERMTIETHHIKALDARALAAALDALQSRSCDCAVIVATDHELVRKAVDSASRRGIAVITLVSDLPGSARKHFIGIDNAAAGRTAASLLGRFCPPGKIGLIAGSLELRDHRERLDAFTGLMREEFPDHVLVGPLEGLDDNAATEKQAAAMLKKHPDLLGLYNFGAGNGGLLRALEKSGRARHIRVIAHELSAPTRKGLASGEIDVVLDQNPDGEIRAALAAARALALGQRADFQSEPIEIGIFLRDNLRQEGSPK
ncbi:MAG TPA: LacI family DNA-binding transcriptional regulator [Devosia sp.]|nr:LacI family DNA-binding transcriptional regulator [Devosia sp.]